MKWAGYIAATDETAVYPDAGSGSAIEFAYIALGLQGELGELFSLQAQDPDDNERLVAELGDCLWYTARAYAALSAARVLISEELSEGAEFSMREALVRALLLGNTTKKLLRGDATPGSLTRGLLLNQLADDYRYLRSFLYAVCRRLSLLEVTPESVMDMNMKKLRQRKAAGTLKGSGDNR